MSLPETVLITADQIKSLEKIRLCASAHHFLLYILAEQAVEALDLDRNDNSYDAQILRRIVDDGISVERAILLITERRAGSALRHHQAAEVTS